MRHRVHGRKLGRTPPHRRALLRNLCTSLLEHERITTTIQKAKEIRPLAEKMITLGKKETLHARRQAARFLLKAAVVQKLFDSIAARYADRSGGYTRILKLGPRAGDGAELAIIELISDESDKESKAAAKSQEKTGDKESKPTAKSQEKTGDKESKPAAKSQKKTGDKESKPAAKSQKKTGDKESKPTAKSQKKTGEAEPKGEG